MTESKPKKARRKKSEPSVPDMPIRPAGWLFDLYQMVYVLGSSGDTICEGKYCGPSSSEKGKHIVRSSNIMMVPPTSIKVKEDSVGS